MENKPERSNRAGFQNDRNVESTAPAQTEINPSNNMPVQPEQEPIYQQTTSISTLRSYSTIPRAERYNSSGDSVCPAIKTLEIDSSKLEAGSEPIKSRLTGKKEMDSTKNSCPVNHGDNSNHGDDKAPKSDVWIYPSEQMFFNAMKRKNHNVNESEVKTIVPIHNAVNEMCWKKILEWESMHKTECDMPKLLKFEGKAKETTIKARFMTLVGYKPPFDRHDWTVDRCGKEIKYIIDFYSGSSRDAPSFYLDVRPALTAGGVSDRLKRWWNPSSAKSFSNDAVTAGIYPESNKKNYETKKSQD